jgi:hypothetical protein
MGYGNLRQKEKVHASMDSLLGSLVAREDGLTELKKALKQAWSNGEAYRLDRMKSLHGRKSELGDKKSDMIHTLTANPDLGDDIKEEIIKIKAEMTEIDIQVAKDSQVDTEFAEFAAFALDYTDDLRKRWWDLPSEKLSVNSSCFGAKLLSSLTEMFTPQN